MPSRRRGDSKKDRGAPGPSRRQEVPPDASEEEHGPDHACHSPRGAPNLRGHAEGHAEAHDQEPQGRGHPIRGPIGQVEPVDTMLHPVAGVAVDNVIVIHRHDAPEGQGMEASGDSRRENH